MGEDPRGLRLREGIHISDQVYDLTLISSSRDKAPIIAKEIADNLSNLGFVLQERMKVSCQRIQRYYGMTQGEDGSCRLEVVPQTFGMGPGEDEGMWKAQFKQMSCPDHMVPNLEVDDRTYYARGYTYGQFDLAVLQTLPNEQWSCRNRATLGTQAGNAFKDVISIPLFRVKHCRGPVKKQDGVRDPSRLAFDKPLVLLTLVRFPSMYRDQCPYPQNERPGECQKMLTCLRSTHLQRFCDRILGLDAERRTIAPFTDVNNHRCELFLTLSESFPAMLKSEFDDFDQVNEFLRDLRSLVDLVAETSSIVVLNEKHLADTTGRYDVTLDKPNTYGLLLKLGTAQTGRETILEVQKTIWRNVLKDELGDRSDTGSKEELEAINEHVEVLQQGYDWDVYIRFKSAHLTRVARTITKTIRGVDNVEQAVTIPYWELPESDAKDNPPRPRRDSSEKADRVKAQKAKCPVTDWEADPLSSSDHEGPLPALPPWPKIAQEDLHLDALNNSLYNLRYDAEWVQSINALLGKAWMANLKPVNTFNLINDTIERVFHRVDTDVERLNDLFKMKIASHRALSRSIALAAEENPDTEPDFEALNRHDQKCEEIKEEIKRIWASSRGSAQRLDAAKKNLTMLAGEFNGRLEGRQITSIALTDPRFGEQAGVIDLVMYATDRLMTSYCGSRKHTKNKDNTDNTNNEQIWRGVVSTSQGQDFHIYPSHQILYLPMNYKLHCFGKPLITAHEAAHQILFDVWKRHPLRPVRRKLAAFWYKLHNQAIVNVRTTYSRIVRASRRLGDAKNERLAHSVFGEVFGKLMRGRRMNLFYESEVLVDLLAGLIAGPAYFAGTVQTWYQPARTRSEAPWQGTHPPDWLRLCLGAKLAEVMGWNQELWKLDRLFHNCMHHEELTSENIRYYQAHLKGLQPKPEEPQYYFRDPKFFIIKALYDDGGTLMKELERWMNRHFDGLAFYPECTGVPPADVVEHIDEYCQRLSVSMFYDDALQMDAPLRYIAAASILEPMERPAYPHGRVLLSLAYSSASDDPLSALPRPPRESSDVSGRPLASSSSATLAR